MESIVDFISDWSKSHSRSFAFSTQVDYITGHPTEVGIRYSAAKYQKNLNAEVWDRLCYFIEVNSHGTMYVYTSEFVFERGIIDIKLSSSNHNYQERLVVGTLMRIAEEFFGVSANTANG